MLITTRKGLDIPLAGAPEQTVGAGRPVTSVALLGNDYTGLRPSLSVRVGDRVRVGSTLLRDKRDPAVNYTSPGGGTVTAIHRGARRALLSVVIELDANEEAETFSIDTTPQGIRAALCASGLWTALRTRPYNRVPRADERPDAVFVTAIDTRPLAADPQILIRENAEDFARGLRALGTLTDGPVYVCTAPDWRGPSPDEPRIVHAAFRGPHPAGLPGTHIHHLAPVGAGRSAWHIGYADVIAIGKLITTGRVWTERIVALGGTGFDRPRLVRSRLGAAVDELVRDELNLTDGRPRIIAGSVLDGRTAEGPENYLGRFHHQISAVPDRTERRLFGWLNLFNGAYSFAGRLARRSGQRRRHALSTAAHGRPTALIPVDAFDRVMPLDILPVPLLRALLVQDTEQARQLGCLELDPEDLALCSFVCPGKNDYGAALRANLMQIERDG